MFVKQSATVTYPPIPNSQFQIPNSKFQILNSKFLDVSTQANRVV